MKSRPDARFEILEVISDDSVVMTKLRITGIPESKSVIDLAMYVVRNGKIESLWVVSMSPSTEGK